jgi:acyl-coenzyme A thioesterase PaaI-like protein
VQVDVLRLVNWYPPFIGAGIRVHFDRHDPLTVRSSLALHWFNRNPYGAHFGGSLYAMCDPFFALILLRALGEEYVVWDKAASIQFVRPGKGRVTATFVVTPERVAEVRREVQAQGKSQPAFQVDVVDQTGQVVAHVDKLLYVKKK